MSLGLSHQKWGELSISIDPFDLPHETKWPLRPQFLDEPHFTSTDPFYDLKIR